MLAIKSRQDLADIEIGKRQNLTYWHISGAYPKVTIDARHSSRTVKFFVSIVTWRKSF